MKSEKGGEGKSREGGSDSNCEPFILRPFDQFIQRFKAFPRARPSWLCLVSPPFSFFFFFFSTFEPHSLVSLRPPPFLTASIPQPRAGAAQRRCSRCTYAIRRHVSAIFCAADESCRDRPTNTSNIPAHRVSPSRGVFSERDTF